MLAGIDDILEPQVDVVSGSFDYGDNLSEFKELLAREHPTVVGFNSPGGNVAKAMEFGRLIRQLDLSTFQIRQRTGEGHLVRVGRRSPSDIVRSDADDRRTVEARSSR